MYHSNSVFKYLLSGLQTRIVLILIFLLFIPTVVLTQYGFTYSEKALNAKTSKLILDNLEQRANQMENLCMDIIKLLNIVSTDKLIVNSLIEQNYLFKNGHEHPLNTIDELTGNEIVNSIKVEKQINYIKNTIFAGLNVYVMIIDANGIVYTSFSEDVNEYQFKKEYMLKQGSRDWNKKVSQGNQAIQWKAPFNYEVDSISQDLKFISASKEIKSEYLQNELGTILVSISEESLRSIMKGSSEGQLLLMNKDGNIILNSEDISLTDHIGKSDIINSIPENERGYILASRDNVKYLLNYYSLNKLAWKLVSILPYKEVVREVNDLKIKIYLLNAVLFTFVLLASILILYIINPLKMLIKEMKSFKIGEYSLEKEIRYPPDDVSGIVKTFHFLFKRIEELAESVIREQRIEHELRYEALRAQINPHFLFNTLNSIKWSAAMNGVTIVSDMISSLGRLLEVSMNKGDEEISLYEELELVEEYVFLQNIRYNDKFKLSFDKDKKYIKYKVPKLILQPIVENSILHGLKNKQSDCKIFIQVNGNESILKIHIYDNGEGISSEKIKTILVEEMDSRSSQKFSGIGLANVHERIKLKYGKQYGLSINSVVGQATEVTVLLPVALVKGDSING